MRTNLNRFVLVMAFIITHGVIAAEIESVSINTIQGTVFPIAIPDNNANGIDIIIDATGSFTGNIENLFAVLNIEHEWVGDLQVTLYAPNNIAKLVIFSGKGRANDDADGDGSNLNGEYIFDDSATQDFWVEGANSGLIPPGSYRTSTPGNSYSNFGGCTTRLSGAFAGLTPAQTNGQWRLHVADIAAGDGGQIIDFGFIADQSPPNYSIFKNSFEGPTTEDFSSIVVPVASSLQGNCKKAQYDFTGSGLSDYVTIWDNAQIDTKIISLVGNNGPNGNDSIINLHAGLISDNTQITSGGDFDGDGITDIVTSQPSEYSTQWNKYIIRRSSRPNDNPMFFHARNDELTNLQIGDYNGDGIDELAWYINSGFGNGLIDYNYAIRTDSTPVGVTKKIAGGFDHNGDGIDDFAVFFDDGLGMGHQIISVFNGLNGALLYGSGTAIFNSGVQHLPGYFNSTNPELSGLGTSFVTGGGSLIFDAFDSTNNFISLINTADLGISTDTPITGDYDGDGIDDFGLWRPDTDGNGSRFIIRPSSDTGNLIEVTPLDSAPSDYPVANSRVQ